MNFMDDRERINKFITKAFDYYNGRINVFNYPAVLNIEWCELNYKTCGGTSRNPNIVTIYPQIIYRYFPNRVQFYYHIIMCVIHELYHTDQEICYIKMASDPQYLQHIEYTVEVETAIYMASHQHEIAENFGICVRDDMCGYYNMLISKYDTGRLYKRRTYLTHMQNIIRDIIFRVNDPIIDLFTRIFTDPNTKIILIINNEISIDLKIGLQCCPVVQLNALLEQYYFQYNYRMGSVKIDGKDNHWNLYINGDNSNIMYRVTRKCI